MYSASHRLNHDFQLRYFMAGGCKTADGAYSLMYAQMIDMESKIKHGEVQRLEREIKRMKANSLLNSFEDLDKLEGAKQLAELEASQYIWNMNLEGAKKELSTIKKLMDELEPLRKYSHLSILEANEACQREEWLFELQSRAENCLISTGTIPPDQLETMRMHPDFQTNIVPHIFKIIESVGKNGFKMIGTLTPNLILLEDKT